MSNNFEEENLLINTSSSIITLEDLLVWSKFNIKSIEYKCFYRREYTLLHILSWEKQSIYILLLISGGEMYESVYSIIKKIVDNSVCLSL